MKIKCPACQAVLNIPDSAAGKVVKCTCGKQLRAPGVASTPASPSQPPPQQPSQARPQQRPAPQRPAGGGGFDPGIFDELTDQDLQPVSAVHRPGQARPAAAPSTGGKLLQQYAPTGGPGYTPTGNMQIAGVGARIGGALVDGFFQMIGVAIAFGIIFAAGALEENGQQPGPAALAAIGVAVLVALIPPIVNVVLISMSGQTVGKKALGTRMVLESTGEPAKFVQGFLVRQLAFGFITNIPVVGVFIALADIGFLFSENAKTLHDRLAGTVVINA
jgi:uncharacterized RDD family membrane protein YckC